MILISPTEPSRFREIGIVSSVPENFGVDFLWWLSDGREMAGVQRKTIPDLVASLNDGRLALGLSKMGDLDLALLVLEVDSLYELEEHTWLTGLLCSMQSVHGIGWTLASTANCPSTLTKIHDWSQKAHGSLLRRPKPTVSWGSARSHAWRSWFWQSFPGIGNEMASRLASRWDYLPFELKVPPSELRSVPGMGKKRVAEILALLGKEDS